jgi:hypothetical protein
MNHEIAFLTIKPPLKERRAPVGLAQQTRGSWFTEQRLRFIESRLFWSGQINRADLMDRFEIHRSIASKDLTTYQALAPRNAVYDRRQKVYRAGKHFLPIFESPTLWRLLGHTLVADRFPGSGDFFQWVQPLGRTAEPATTRNIIAAADTGVAIKIFYRSMENPQGGWRWIEPHSIVFDGHRWHTRAFCHQRGDFRDFVLSRVERAEETKGGTTDSAKDEAWHAITTIQIKPHRLLNTQQAKLVERDYGMTSGMLVIRARRALVRYLLVNLGLDENRSPPRQVLELAEPKLRQLLFT